MNKENLNFCVIFDLDGVIIDSNPYHRIAWTNFLLRKNIVIKDSDFKELIFGTTGDEAITKLLNCDCTKEELDAYSKEIDGEYREIVKWTENIEPVNGLLHFIQNISDQGFKIALATSAPSENVDLILNKFQILKYFDLIIDKTMVVESKPNPEIYLKVVHSLGVDKNKCIVFEDSFSGVLAAKNAGLKVIGVTTSHSNNELAEVGAVLCINDFTEISPGNLLEIIERNS